MATQFRSAAQRGFWLGILVAVIFDAIVAYVISWFIADNAFQALGIAALIVAAVYVFQLLYGLISIARGAIVFTLEKESRIATTVDRMAAAKMPRPDDFYSDPEEYLMQVATSPKSTNEAKLFAGATIGGLQTLRSTNHGFLAITLTMVIEAAIERYGQRFGLRNFEGELEIESGA